MSENRVLIIGTGLSGAVIAERFANINNTRVLMIEKRNHIGGNCYDYVDEDTGILLNKYGAHLFHTNSDKVWSYINKFSEWVRWDHQVVCSVDNKIVPLPVNINTVNSLLNLNIANEKEMDDWLSSKQVKFDYINNSEKMGKSRVGEELYNKLFKDYTYKQWNKYPEELDPSILARIPVRNNFDNRYFSDKYQALPKYGYTNFIKNLLNHKNIEIKINLDYLDFIKTNKEIFDIIIFTGPIDTFYNVDKLEKLEYRSINFEIKKIKNVNYYQSNSVVNYSSLDIPYTRIVEYKHFLNQKSNDTIIVKETTTNDGEPYYPVLNEKNINLFKKYKELSEKETKIHFLGRLANYKYFNMDEAILNSLNYFENFFRFTNN
jgi:UDP-galactopyranose mutase